MKRTPASHPRAWSLALFAMALIGTSTLALDKAASVDAQALYQQQRAVCLSGQSNQDRATCLREAGAALAEARNGGPGDDATQYRRNASLRCVELPDGDRQACLARMQGQGSRTGSAQAGGIYRENVTRETAAPLAAASSAASSAASAASAPK